MRKRWCIYTTDIYAAIKTDELLPFATTQEELKGILVSRVSQSENNSYHMII